MSAKLKGNLIVGQSGGPTAVINSSLAGVVQEAKKYAEIEHIYGMWHGIEGVLKEEIIDLGRQSARTIQGLRRTPSAALGSCRHKLTDKDYERILAVLKAHNIRYFLYIGGNDSADTSARVAKLAQEKNYELRVMGIPKTIDNDLAYTDHCPGYGSVARFVATAVRDAGLDTEAIGVVDTVKVIEIMGRNAGWITASAALGKMDEDSAPHLIYVPERRVVLDKMLDDVQKVYDRLHHVVIVVCEGVKGETGELLAATGGALYTDAFGHKQLGGAADYICRVIADRLKLKARFDKPGTIQRMSMALASPVDLQEAYTVGATAVKKAVEGTTGYMVTIVRESNEPYKSTTGLAKLEEVANAERLMPDEFINAAGNGVTEAFLAYARPLIGPPLPRYVRLTKHWVAKKA